MIASAVLYRALERLKHGLSFSEKVGTIRAEKIGEVWEVANRLMFASENAVRRAAEIVSVKSQAERNEDLVLKLGPIEAEAQKLSQDLKELAQINRYWTGEVLYSKFRDFHNLSGDYKIAYAAGDIKKLKDIERQIEEIRTSVIEQKSELLS